MVVAVPIPSGLKNFLNDPQHSPWNVSPSVAGKLLRVPEKNYAIASLSPFDREAYFVQRYFQQDPPPGLSIKAIHAVLNRNAQLTFEATLPAMETQSAGLPSNWRQADCPQERGVAMQRFSTFSQAFIPFFHPDSDGVVKEYKNIHLLPLWHGTSAERADHIANSALLYFGKSVEDAQKAAGATDDGFFGRGIYLTNSADYASKYAALHQNGTLLFCWAAFREPFPIISHIPNTNPRAKPNDRCVQRMSYDNSEYRRRTLCHG
jgi:hypothetical protein